MRLPFRLVDVFTDRPLAGNQLCVIPEPVDVPPDLMQAVAKEIGFSETTFVTQAQGDRYAMRIFTPEVELPFAGHPTLGTAFVLVSEGRVTSPVTQEVAAGEFAIEVDVARGFARMRQADATYGSVIEDRPSVAAALRLEPSDLHPVLPSQVVATGIGHLMVPLRDAATVARAIPEPPALSALVTAAGTDAVYVFAVTEDTPEGSRAKARLFTSSIGVGEDPATGSAAGPLGVYLARYAAISSQRLTISQGEEIGRPSTLYVDIERLEDGFRPFVGGGVARVGEGFFDLPD